MWAEMQAHTRVVIHSWALLFSKTVVLSTKQFYVSRLDLQGKLCNLQR